MDITALLLGPFYSGGLLGLLTVPNHSGCPLQLALPERLTASYHAAKHSPCKRAVLCVGASKVGT